MTENHSGDATRLSARKVEDATVLSSRATVKGELDGVAEGDTVLSSRSGGVEETKLSVRGVADATQLSSRLQAAPQEELPPMGVGTVAPVSEIGVSSATVAYDPGSEGIVLTTYEPRIVQSFALVQPTPDEIPVPEVDFALLGHHAEVERRYERATSRWMGVTAAAGLLLFGASVTGLVVFLQGF